MLTIVVSWVLLSLVLGLWWGLQQQVGKERASGGGGQKRGERKVRGA